MIRHTDDSKRQTAYILRTKLKLLNVIIMVTYVTAVAGEKSRDEELAYADEYRNIIGTPKSDCTEFKSKTTYLLGLQLNTSRNQTISDASIGR
jgi:hypothetical protein